ncbi:MAG: biotin--[acetyl-CoA-carboxylase] ligase [Planctomycetota bacterium]|jgi:BirA family biotin operon repressor/biotin-[acetyl-CoA-carboxylase] ligase|nr:biotin--[acetyl-CoA-carboxylase] ligase [Planctomycetota bacterium]
MSPTVPEGIPHRLIRHVSVDSTNEQALLAVAAGSARHGDVHLAEDQTAGRGRLGRSWASPPGAGLYASLILLPEPTPPPPETLTVAAGLAVVATVDDLGARGARLRWPNDVLVAGAKLAGILVETRGLDPRAPHFVIGIGLNVRHHDLPAQVLGGRIVTSLEALGVSAEPEAVLGLLLEHLDRRLAQSLTSAAALAQEFLERTCLADAPVSVRHGNETTSGVLRELDWKKGLLLDCPDGEARRVALPLVRAVEPLD